jgi:hypothetical protein
MKDKLYQAFIERMDAAREAGYHFEACWYASALLEDRLVSMLESTGGVPLFKNGKNKGQPIRMLGPKLAELLKRANTNMVLKQNVELSAIHDWVQQRNELMHRMAEGTKPLGAIESDANALAQVGAQAVRRAASAARRLKKHRRR